VSHDNPMIIHQSSKVFVTDHITLATSSNSNRTQSRDLEPKLVRPGSNENYSGQTSKPKSVAPNLHRPGLYFQNRSGDLGVKGCA